MDVLDTSPMLAELSNHAEHLADRAATVARLPAVALGTTDPSGYALEISLGPLDALIGAMRLARAHKYRLLLKFVQRLHIAGQHPDWVGVTPLPAEYAFGPYNPTDKAAVLTQVTEAFGAGVMSLETAVRMLRESGWPIDDIEDEITQIQSRRFEQARFLADATGSTEAVVLVTYTAASPAGGQPSTGTVEFTPVAPAISLPEYGIVFSGRGIYTLDKQGRLVDTDGTVGVPLLPCDIPGANPAAWVWQVTITLTDAGPRRFYLSLSITHTKVDLGTVTQVDPSRAHYVAVPGPTDAETPAGALEKIAAHAAAADPHGDRAWASEEFCTLAQGTDLSRYLNELGLRVEALEAALALAEPQQVAPAESEALEG
ncbi:hypothetical protein ACFCXK_31735 [Streptomyces sp. NPDC056269]|uniref:hypothetical protein n=1 Tax=Streptomyces sp. NPDC056269 TaxID=3345768 RepID=UPI0035D724A0